MIQKMIQSKKNVIGKLDMSIFQGNWPDQKTKIIVTFLRIILIFQHVLAWKTWKSRVNRCYQLRKISGFEVLLYGPGGYRDILRI